MPRRTGALLLLVILIVAAWTCVFDASRARAARPASDVRSSGNNLDLRLRSFILGAEGNLSVKPTATGGRVHLRVRNLPRPQVLAPTARAYVVWATASSSSTLNLGELKMDKRGDGELKFATPARLEHYSLIVTAESSASAKAPLGAPVLATRAGEVAALFTEKKAKAGEAATPEKANEKAAKKENSARNAKTAQATRRPTMAQGFFGEVDDALNTGASRTLHLIGSPAAPSARGIARVATLNGSAYVWMRVSKLPASSDASASLVLWAVTPGGRAAYLGSLPASALNTGDTYVRASGVNFDKFDLAVTSEKERPVASPKGQPILVSSDKAVRSFSARPRHHLRRKRKHRRVTP